MKNPCLVLAQSVTERYGVTGARFAVKSRIKVFYLNTCEIVSQSITILSKYIYYKIPRNAINYFRQDQDIASQHSRHKRNNISF